MAGKQLSAEERFIKKLFLTDTYSRAKEVTPNLWEMLERVQNHYREYAGNCEAIVQKETMEILKDSESKGIHSARFRIKQSESLLEKIVRKKALLSKDIQDDYDIEKYRELDADNYYKIITDLCGIRVLIRYREQWKQVHEWIWKKYYRGSEWYLRDFVKDYKTNPGKAFIAEKPKVYYRNEQDKIFYEEFGKDIFDFRSSDEGYNSVHYIVNVDGKYIEIQLRTILDEAWGECTHDIVYKGAGKSNMAELKYLSRCLAQQTVAAETITNLIYEKVNGNGTIFGKTRKKRGASRSSVQDEKKPHGNKVETRMKLLEEKKEEEFDGNLDSLM